MINVQVDEDYLVDLLVERVGVWTDDSDVIDLFKSMYRSYADGGCFDGMEIDIMNIVDNDYVNWCSVIYDSDNDFEELKEIYKEQGLGDCSCEIHGYSYIEAVDNEENPTMFLVRH